MELIADIELRVIVSFMKSRNNAERWCLSWLQCQTFKPVSGVKKKYWYIERDWWGVSTLNTTQNYFRQLSENELRIAMEIKTGRSASFLGSFSVENNLFSNSSIGNNCAIIIPLCNLYCT